MNDAGKVAIAVALITTVGSVAVAVIANRPKDVPAAAGAAASTATVTPPVDDGPVPGSAPSGAPSTPPVPAASSVDARTLPAGLRGAWRDQFGTAWTLTPDADGRVVRLDGVADAKRLRGALRPSPEAADWIAVAITADKPPSPIRCRGGMDGPDRLTADCTDADGTYSWVLTRAG